MPGSVLLVSVGRGAWSASPNAPTDNQLNTFTLAGTTHPYVSWPMSQTGLYRAAGADGGLNHTFSMTWGDLGGSGDEVTLSALEVRGVTTIESTSWVERPASNLLTSNSVTTAGPAVLVAWWWGSGAVRPVGTSHVATPQSGFTLIPGATGLVSLSSNGYVQVAAAYRVVSTAGTYAASWATSNEGAQLYLVALH